MRLSGRRGISRTAIAGICFASLLTIVLVSLRGPTGSAGPTGSGCGDTVCYPTSEVVCTTKAPATCTVTIQNPYLGDTHTVSCGIVVNGSRVIGSNAGTAASNITAKGTAIGVCTIQMAGGKGGSEVVGDFETSNGASTPFRGTWS